ncbi:hypothetical protein [Pseudomonas proteolytica]|uniref:hypothetical protein n=1 Tax=Pseudomonas proteolytica TaxID=219574 RepID=UPI00147466A0|nr:hypothetical protein [Pseudomonas proteolytica]NMZ33976.1 hypothetical protein [Pseudomonas proteolytica]
MQDAAEAFVRAKDRIDSEGRSYVSGNWWERFLRKVRGYQPPLRAWSAIHPGKFVMQSLPFSATGFDYNKSQAKYLNPFLIVSGTYNDYSPNPLFTPLSAVEIMDWSDGLATREEKRHLNSPRVYKIGDLPLYVASEGKNRVELFKNAKREMKVLVAEVPYPAASELTLIRSRPFNIYSLCYRGEVRVLPEPGIALPLLQAYGVNLPLSSHVSFKEYLCLRRVRQCIISHQMIN